MCSACVGRTWCLTLRRGDDIARGGLQGAEREMGDVDGEEDEGGRASEGFNMCSGNGR